MDQGIFPARCAESKMAIVVFSLGRSGAVLDSIGGLGAAIGAFQSMRHGGGRPTGRESYWTDAWQCSRDSVDRLENVLWSVEWSWNTTESVGWASSCCCEMQQYVCTSCPFRSGLAFPPHFAQTLQHSLVHLLLLMPRLATARSEFLKRIDSPAEQCKGCRVPAPGCQESIEKVCKACLTPVHYVHREIRSQRACIAKNHGIHFSSTLPLSSSGIHARHRLPQAQPLVCVPPSSCKPFPS
ncbi:hypothetical protein B0J14DRAFT_65118 [Halenospora varia]|nr:hypothetical protein B0J14DRAFT_65118 [Halenospora varia]